MKKNEARFLGPKRIMRLSKELQQRVSILEARDSCVVMFADLVGSTDFKEKVGKQHLWLPWLVEFLDGVSRIVKMESGRVVKYIGDEVMAIFSGKSSVFDAEHCAEKVLLFCRDSSGKFQSRIGLDYGPVCFIDFVESNGDGTGELRIPRDPQGTTVDRCARIMKKIPPGALNIACCSEQFAAQSNRTGFWRRCGQFHAKGIRDSVKVHQISGKDIPAIKITDAAMSLPSCLKKLQKTEVAFERYKALHRPQ